ncbi:HNH endonuclease [Bdellovibrionota bacterium FG-2]
MKNLKSVPDVSLLSQIRQLAADERKLTTQVLELLREVERRRLYAGQGFSSLFEYAVKELGYSEASASRRINSMRLLKEVPSAAASIESGALNLSTVSTVQCFLKREAREQGKTYSAHEKRELLMKMEGRSHRECEKILCQISPESAVAKENTRVISPTQTELRIVASDELMQKLEKSKGLLAHSHPNLGLAQLLELLADRTLEQVDPEKKRERKEKRAEAKTGRNINVAPVFTHEPMTSTSESSRYIPAALRAEVWRRDRGTCTFVSPETGKKCESRHGLQVDHVLPVALGGRAELSNLRILCSCHNSWEAIQKIGSNTMKRYVPGLR